MIPRYKKKALIGIPVGLGLKVLLVLLVIWQNRHPGKVAPPFGLSDNVAGLLYVLLVLALLFGGLGFYCWGCAALAKAKGYSTAIVLTVVLGILFPAVLLLALPDKNKHHHRREL